MILCLGPSGAGKTLLLRTLQEDNPHAMSDENLLLTVPTVGVNLVNILNKHGNNPITLRELGGCMAPIWKQYFSDCLGILYVIDSRNLQQVSAACILLLELLNHPILQNSPVCIVLNKIDIRTSMSSIEFKDVLMLDEICMHAPQQITVIETSCVTGKGVHDIKEWLEKVS